MKNVNFLFGNNSVRSALRQSKPANSSIDKMQQSYIPPRIVRFDVGRQNGLLMTHFHFWTNLYNQFLRIIYNLINMNRYVQFIMKQSSYNI